ncbi:MAG: hypothetical protein JWR63_1196, partial [Conexibacter sp.]|nr:hypothetical protein [Conexibacter sp.]
MGVSSMQVQRRENGSSTRGRGRAWLLATVAAGAAALTGGA